MKRIIEIFRWLVTVLFRKNKAVNEKPEQKESLNHSVHYDAKDLVKKRKESFFDQIKKQKVRLSHNNRKCTPGRAVRGQVIFLKNHTAKTIYHDNI